MSITSPRRFLSLLELALTTPDEKIARVRIQGSGNLINGAAVEEASTQEIRTKVAEWKNPEFEEGEAADKPVDPTTVDVAVMNGSGRVLAAEDLADALRERRYAARAAGNADAFDYDTSVVYYADGFREPARKIRGFLGSSASTAPLDRGRRERQRGGRRRRRRLGRHAQAGAQAGDPPARRHGRHDQPRGPAAARRSGRSASG